METLHQYIRALIFASHEPITLAELKSVIGAHADTVLDDLELRKAIDDVKDYYHDHTEEVMEVVEIDGGLQFMTKSTYAGLIGAHIKQQSKKKLSKSALETLSIIAYKQPITKAELEAIRGVNCDYSIQKLLEKDLVTIAGRAERVGRPLLYATSPKFMNHFGLEDLSELPKLSEWSEVTTLPLPGLNPAGESHKSEDNYGETTSQSSSEE